MLPDEWDTEYEAKVNNDSIILIGGLIILSVIVIIYFLTKGTLNI